MLDETLKKKAMALGRIMEMQVSAYSKESNSFDDLTFGTADELVINVLYSARIQTKVTDMSDSEHLFHFEDPNNLSFLAVNLSEQNTCFLFGPFFHGNKDPKPLIKACEEQFGSRIPENRIKSMLATIPIKDDFFIEAWKTLVCMVFSLNGNTRMTVLKKTEENKESQKKTLPLNQMSSNRIVEKHISEGYLFEQKIRRYLIKADKASLQELLVPRSDNAMKKTLEMYGHNTKDRQGMNRLRYVKNVTIVLNTVFRLTAESTGLPPLYLHSISDKVAKSIEASNSLDDIVGIISQMINTYCDVIKRLNIENHSYRIVRVQKYIIANLTEALSLEQLAKIAETSPQHLSRLFRKECGLTITDYIRKQRIGEAKWMLQSSNNPIYEIAESLGFSSQNYFCNVFQKETGMTPSEFKAYSENQVI